MTGWKGSTRHARLPAGWSSRIQPSILARDGYRCQTRRADTGGVCGAAARQVDHIVPGDDHSPANLTSICDHHHGNKSGREGGVASGASRRAKADAKPKPLHPGVMAAAPPEATPRPARGPEGPAPF